MLKRTSYVISIKETDTGKRMHGNGIQRLTRLSGVEQGIQISDDFPRSSYTYTFDKVPLLPGAYPPYFVYLFYSQSRLEVLSTPNEVETLQRLIHDYTHKKTMNLEELFNKQYTFSRTSNDSYVLPNSTEIFNAIPWTTKTLKLIKSRLNGVKNETGKHDLKNWSSHTKNRDPCHVLIHQLRTDYCPELLTQAWIKFFEILSKFHNDFKSFANNCIIDALHLCEAPGAFITSLNHFLKTSYNNVQYKYTATTLNPYYCGNNLTEMINDDRFILLSIENWNFGSDDTGNITLYENYLDLVTTVKRKASQVNFITADGSIDCMSDPGNQEAIVAHLIYCETITALSLLSEGGAYIFKMFTMFECSSINLLYLVNCCFEKIHVFKPCSSKGGNSEVYVICINYCGIKTLDNILPILLKQYSHPQKKYCMFSHKSIPLSFIQQIENCAKLFSDYQIKVIEENLRTYGSNNNEEYTEFQNSVANNFINKCNVEQLDSSMYVVNKKLYWLYRNCIYGKSQIKHVESTTHWPYVQGIFYIGEEKLMKKPNFKIIVGRKINNIMNSKFLKHDFKITFDDIKNYFSTDFDSIKLKLENQHSNENIHYLNVAQFYDENNFDKYEKKCFDEIINILKNMSSGHSLCILGFLPLTYFAICVLFVLKNNFKFFGCHFENYFVFSDYVYNFNLGLTQLISVQNILKSKFENSSFVSDQNESIVLQTNLTIKTLDNFEKCTENDIECTILSDCIKMKRNYEKTVLRFICPKEIVFSRLFQLIQVYFNSVFIKKPDEK